MRRLIYKYGPQIVRSVKRFLVSEPVETILSSSKRYAHEASLARNNLDNGVASQLIAKQPLHRTLLEAIWRHSTTTPNRIAFMSAEDNSVCVTYRDLYLYAQSISSYLLKEQFKRGDIACVVLPNCWQFLAFIVGTLQSGGAISGVSYRFVEHEIEQQLSDSGCKFVLTTEESMHKVLNASKNCPLIKKVIVIPDREIFLSKKHEEDERKAVKQEGLPAEVVPWSTVLSQQPDAYKQEIKINVAKDLALLPYSSGTTGSPKGVMLTHRNIGTMLNVYLHQTQTEIIPKLSSDWDWAEEKTLLVLPFYHIYGFGLACATIVRGSIGITFNHFDGDLYCSNIQQHRVRILTLVPPILVFLSKSAIVSKYDLSSVIMMTGGAAPAGKDLCDEVRSKHKNVRYIIQGYGMTEVSLASHLPDIEDGQKFGNCGKLALTFEQKIVDVQSRKECGVGEKGEILVRGPTIMRGYLNRPEATAETIDKDGWLHTGDIGYLDEHGYLFIVDRLKELIKVRGFQVPPAELEDILLSHPQIKDAAVIGIPDEAAGELPKAFVVRVDDSLTENDVLEYVDGKVSDYKRLKGGVTFVDAIPKLASGKILRRELRELAMA